MILGQADSVVYVSRQYYDGCMIDRNHRLVEAAGLLLAVYNGERRGGTAATVRYAQKMGREIYIIDPVSSENMCSGPFRCSHTQRSAIRRREYPLTHNLEPFLSKIFIPTSLWL